MAPLIFFLFVFIYLIAVLGIVMGLVGLIGFSKQSKCVMIFCAGFTIF